MVNVYFVRHAESDHSVRDAMTRPLTEKGRIDCRLVTDFLNDKRINSVYSSPYKRAFDTVLPFAESIGLQVEIVEDFREREFDTWVEDFTATAKSQWNDFFLTLHGECLADVQSRNVAALSQIISKADAAAIAVGTHGTALSTIINYFDPNYGFEDFLAMADKMPWIVKMQFDGTSCVNIEKIDLY